MSGSVPLSVPGEALRPVAGSLPARLAGVFRSPRATFAALVAEPRWADVLAQTLLVTFLSSAALLTTEVGQLALVDQWERTALAFGQPVDDARYAALLRASENGVLYSAISALATGPLVAFAMSALIVAVFGRGARRTATYRQALAVVSHAGAILALRQMIAAPLDYARETLASPATLAALFPTLDAASPLARFLGVIDLFVLWWLVVLAIGTSVLYHRRARPLAFGFVGAYAALAGLLAAVMAASGGSA